MITFAIAATTEYSVGVRMRSGSCGSGTAFDERSASSVPPPTASRRVPNSPRLRKLRRVGSPLGGMYIFIAGTARSYRAATYSQVKPLGEGRRGPELKRRSRVGG